jgi:DNA polymerase IV (archaeal DinB-like DNA polymerase)
LARAILHIDFDYFFAQCEELRSPEIKSHPVVVCVFSGRTEESGVVSTANYAARKYGVKSGIPITVAKSRLIEANDAVFLPIDAEYYKQISERAMSVIRNRTDVFERVGIDECFVDVSERIEGDFDRAENLARQIKDEVKRVAQISCSVGVAPSKMLAKIASDLRKPDNLTVIRPEEAKKFVSSLNVDRIPGIGPKTRSRLADLDVETAGDLAAFDIYRLIEEFGKKNATYMHNAAKGIDDSPVRESGWKHKQIMRIATLKQDATSAIQMYNDLEEICKSVYESVAKKNLAFKSVGIILILSNLDTVTRSKTLKSHVLAFGVLVSTARAILDEAVTEGPKVRRLGVKVSDFQDSSGQETLFDFMVR